MRSPQVTVAIDLARIRANAAAIRRAAGVDVIAVVKADAYGLGAERVAGALAGAVDGLCVYSLAEAVAARLWPTAGLPVIAVGPPTGDAAAYRRAHVRPAVSTIAQAAALRAARPILCVDTGMQRFACPPAAVAAVAAAGACDEAFTHAATLGQARALRRATAGLGLRLHAAASALLAARGARLDAVRPGLALYRGAVRVATRLAEARDTRGPVGYGGFRARRHGVIPLGYAHGLRAGPCLVAGVRSRIREVGMQSAYVELGPGARAGDEVVLLGDGLGLEELARAWNAKPHEVLVTLAGAGERSYRDGRRASRAPRRRIPTSRSQP